MKDRILPVLLTLLLAGCSAGPSVHSPAVPVAYTPLALPAHLGGTAVLEVTYEPGTELVAAWVDDGFRETAIQKHRQAVVAAITNDLASGRLFDQVLPAGTAAHPDHLVKVRGTTVQADGRTTLRLTLQMLNGATGRPEATVEREYGLGPVRGPHQPLAQVLPQLLQGVKRDLAAAMARKAREDAELAEIAGFQRAALSDLLFGSDASPAIARERNRAIIAAKNRQLADILRNWKTERITALVVQIEQTILDLNHECEVAKDKAQQSVADGTPSGAGTEVRRARLESFTGREPAATEGVQGFVGVNLADAGPGGAAVQEVVPGGPAERAGIRAADVIVAVDDQPVASPQELQARVGRTLPGTSLRLAVRRGDTPLSFVVTAGRRPGAAAPASLDALRDLAISYRERIELLKPILAALKEEIANRNQ